ncbi:Uncharacterised protein [uncultured archaeon]|nr:Uncharacterised protein [uncultured archaeon]
MNSRFKAQRAGPPKFRVVPPRWAVNYKLFLKTYSAELEILEGKTFAEFLKFKTVSRENAIKFELKRLLEMRKEWLSDPKEVSFARNLTPKVLLGMAERNISIAYGAKK